MKIIKTIYEMKSYIRSRKEQVKVIGLVPTMGSLHHGHISLINECRNKNEITIISIFVNPVQFNSDEDYAKYPKDFEKDFQIAENSGVDVIFAPSVKEMYPDGYKTYVNVGQLTEPLCGKSRPGHFRGVATVVCKLLNIVEPNNAYFGQKDIQQAIVIKQMVYDLNLNTKIITCPTVREIDGLAMSSRNIHLNTDERNAAVIISKSLFAAKDKIINGEYRKQIIIDFISSQIKSEKLAEIDYIDIVAYKDLKEINFLNGSIIIAAAVWIGKTRLIDNIIINI
jgi:pantoate--beta-alanine ligase